MKLFKKYPVVFALITLLLGLILGRFFFGGDSSSEDKIHAEQNEKGTIWTCSMHPQIRQNEPGDCPLCGMDLIPLSDEQGDENENLIKMSESAMKLANIQTSKVAKQKPIKNIRLNGKVVADERQTNILSSHIPGRLEKLLVNFTGEQVVKGQILAYVYSPELITAQEELFEAKKMKDSQPALFEAAKEKLKNWKLTEQQINQILSKGDIQSEFPVLSDASGTVVKKQINVGEYVQKGQSMFEIVNLDKVWVLFEVYENDLPWIHKGDEVSFIVHSFPGEKRQGKIEFIDPIISAKTRVASARISVSNKDNRLKPEMFVVGNIEAPLKISNDALVVPKSAVMWTGERSIVYVKTDQKHGVGFELREVVLGSALGDSYVVNSGLSEGEEIAVNGTFSIDAAAQLAGKPSMMNPKDEMQEGSSSSGQNEIQKVEINAMAKKALQALFENYFLLKDELVNDRFNQSIESSKSMLKTLNQVDMKLFENESHEIWMSYHRELNKTISKAIQSKNIEELRRSFKPLSEKMIQLIKQFDPINTKIYVDYCPMAIQDQGADWLSKEKAIKNPYFGASMLKCGEVKQVINQ